MSNTESKLELRQIRPGDKFAGFSVGDNAFVALKVFLQKQALSYHIKSLGKTYAVFSSSETGTRAIAYITLVCGEIVVKKGEIPQDNDVNYNYPSYPAVKIARLAVDARYRKSGLGRYLVSFALGSINSVVSPTVGCRFVVVDARSASIPFYRKCGFTLIDTDANRARDCPIMFLDLLRAV